MFNRTTDPYAPVKVRAHLKRRRFTSKDGYLTVTNEWIQFEPMKVVGSPLFMLTNIGNSKLNLSIHISEIRQMTVGRRRLDLSDGNEQVSFVQLSKSQVVFDRIARNVPAHLVIQRTESSIWFRPFQPPQPQLPPQQDPYAHLYPQQFAARPH
jgi:hypothetical protein